MPRIPTYDGPQVALQQLPGAGYTTRATPEDFGSTAAGLLAQAGNNLAAHADRVAQIFDAEDDRIRAANVRMAINDAYARLREIDDGTAERPGLYQRKGQAGLNIYKEAVGSYRKAAQGAQGALGTQREVEAYRAHMDAALSRRLDHVARAQIQNRERYRIQGHKTALVNALREGISHPDPNTLRAVEGQIRENVAGLYEGEDPETIAMETENLLHALYAGSLDAIVREDPLAAEEFLSRYEDRILPEAREQIRDVVQGAVRLTRVPAEVDAWIGGAGGVRTQAELYSRINETYRDPDDAQVARQHGRIRLAEIKAEAEQAQEAMWRGLRNKIIAGKVISIEQLRDDLPMMSDTQFRMAESLIESRATRKTNVQEELYKWNALSDRAKAHMTEDDLMRILPNFTAETQDRIQRERASAVQRRQDLDYWYGKVEAEVRPKLDKDSRTASDLPLKEYVLDLAQAWRERTKTEDLDKVWLHVESLLKSEFIRKGAARIRVADLLGDGRPGYAMVQPVSSVVISATDDSGGNEVQWLPNDFNVRDQVYYNKTTGKVQAEPPAIEDRIMEPPKRETYSEAQVRKNRGTYINPFESWWNRSAPPDPRMRPDRHMAAAQERDRVEAKTEQVDRSRQREREWQAMGQRFRWRWPNEMTPGSDNMGLEELEDR